MTGTERRVRLLADHFLRVFGRPPTVVSRAPGRVNLLGEHTDYNGLPVLPMAIGRAILIAGAPRDDDRVCLANADAAFAPRRYEIAGVIEPFAAGDWGNYHKAAVQDLVRLFGTTALRGGDYLVDGDIPAGAGLSSSAALVVAGALAFLATNGRDMPALELAERMASAERYVGTMSGGMDQAASLCGEVGCALRVDFEPLHVLKVPVREGYSVVVCDSLVKAEKSGAVRRAYNRRVAECRLVCRVLERALGTGVPRAVRSLGELTRLFPERPLCDFLRVLENVLPPRPVSLEDIATLAGSTPRQLAADARIGADGEPCYPLLQRARHVLTEAERVDRAEAALASGDWPVFGALMDASHASCRDDYEVSCPEVEDLVSAAKAAGAIGARLTGAGFGGCTVNLVAVDDVAQFRAFVERAYYQGRPEAEEREHCFVFSPGAGASVVRL